jgi:phosphoglycolate phosphatase-like HAD superfamily hydrolase
LKLVLFDIDGTLIHGGSAGRRSIGAAFREVFGLSNVEDLMTRVAFNGRTDPAIIRDLAAAGGIPPELLDERIESLYETYLSTLRAITSGPYGARYCPGIPDVLDALERLKGVALGLLTGNIEAGARIKLQAFDLNRYFPEGGFGSDSEDRAVIASQARRRFENLVGHSIASRDVLVVGDTVHDVACGRGNGFRTLAVATGGVPVEALRQSGADLVFKDLGDVSAVMTAVKELMALEAG